MDTITQWNCAAQKYMDVQEQSEYVYCNKQVVIKRFPRLNGEKVLDLGCGYGSYTDYFRSIGADVIGIDGSEAMLKLAETHYPECTFQLANLDEKLQFSNETFDLVFCNQVLMDIENVELVFAECRRLLKKNGILYYTIVHPAFYDGNWLKDENGFKYAKAIKNYIKEYRSENIFWGETTHFHRSFSYYLNTAAENGFMLIHAEEPVSYDGKSKNHDLPLFFAAEYKKI